MAFVEGFAALGSVPSVDELARGFVFHRAADSEFHIAHWTPPNPSDSKTPDFSGFLGLFGISPP
jgi:hypothetical protein